MDGVKALMEVFARGKSPPLEDLQKILIASKRQHEVLPNVVRVAIPTRTPANTATTESESTRLPRDPPGGLVVCGDTHGQYTDLIGMIFSDKVAGFPSPENVFIFNGDFVDRGENSLGVIITLLAIKLASPSALHLIRGNHESIIMNERFGFTAELKVKFPNDHCELFRLFTETFNALPLAAVIEDRVFVVHGGVGPVTYKMTLAEIDKLNRFRQPDFADLPLDSMREVDGFTSQKEREMNSMGELLWSDPVENFSGFKRNSRGGGTTAFGADATRFFLSTNKLQYMIRSHVMQAKGYSVGHEGRCVTVFSAPNYCNGQNLGAVLRYRDPTKVTDPEVLQYKAVSQAKAKAKAAEAMG